MKEVGRLALREEGDYWNAYYAMSDTMEGAIFLGSIAMAAIADNPKRRRIFLNLMKELVADVLEAKIGTRPSMIEREAPAHERTKGKH